MSRVLPRIAIVTHHLGQGGGASTMAVFLHRVLNESGQYRAEMVSLAQSSSDPVSTHLRRPGAWRRGPSTERRTWRGVDFVHVGAEGVEYEPNRYEAREALSDLLRTYDFVQVVAGTPPWACPALNLGRPCFLWTATTLWADRASRIQQEPASRRWLHHAVAARACKYERIALEQCDHVFALSPYTLDAVKKLAPASQVSLAPSGVDTDFFHPSANGKADYILSAARFGDPRKNVALMLEAYRRLIDRVPGAPDLVLAGEQISPTAQQRLAELGLTDRVRFTGMLEPDRLAEVYRDAQFFVLSSDEEGLGIVLLEAMASGLPAVSTRCGGPEIIIQNGENGFLTPVGDAEALAGAMVTLARDAALRKQLGRAARVRVEEMFSLRATVRPFLERYSTFMKAPAGETFAYV